MSPDLELGEESSSSRTAHANHQRVNVLFVTTGRQRMLNMIEKLRQMPKPNRAAHRGKGLFWFCKADMYTLDRPESILEHFWENTGDSRVIGCLLPASPTEGRPYSRNVQGTQ